jgi:Nickel responsive protein SCO4226-like
MPLYKVFCLVEAPSKEVAAAIHREAHGLVADEIVEVQEGD